MSESKGIPVTAAPSSRIMMTRGPGSASERVQSRSAIPAATGPGGATAGPRAASGSASDAMTAIANSEAPTRLPRRPTE